jgi:mRNA-degrading endonuclease RelE of RelBE toxin-antitoxin system
MTWRLVYARQVAKSLRGLPVADHHRIVATLDAIQADPLAGDVKALTGYPVAFRRRVGNCRILFDLDPAQRKVFICQAIRRSATTYSSRQEQGTDCVACPCYREMPDQGVGRDLVRMAPG